jgi:anti-sigma factor RsiW
MRKKYMCPDTELLSAYYDDELDGFWEPRVAEHVSRCAVCQGKLDSFARLSEDLGQVEVPEFEAGMLRSWQAIQNARETKTVKIWNKRISVPVPVLAAAAAVFVAVFGLGVFLNLNGSPAPSAPEVAVQQPQIAPVDFQVSNLNDLLNYLNSKDLGTNVTIQLPKGVDQLSVGQPQLIRAADFNRGQ